MATKRNPIVRFLQEHPVPALLTFLASLLGLVVDYHDIKSLWSRELVRNPTRMIDLGESTNTAQPEPNYSDSTSELGEPHEVQEPEEEADAAPAELPKYPQAGNEVLPQRSRMLVPQLDEEENELLYEVLRDERFNTGLRARLAELAEQEPAVMPPPECEAARVYEERDPEQRRRAWMECHAALSKRDGYVESQTVAMRRVQLAMQKWKNMSDLTSNLMKSVYSISGTPVSAARVGD